MEIIETGFDETETECQYLDYCLYFFLHAKYYLIINCLFHTGAYLYKFLTVKECRFFIVQYLLVNDIINFVFILDI